MSDSTPATAPVTAPASTIPSATPAADVPEGDEKFRRFKLGNLVDNSNGWGPATASLPPHLLGLPFMPFNKNEKVFRIADWNTVRGGAISANRPEEEEVAREDDEGGAFSLVDNKPKLKPKYQQQTKPFKRFAPSASQVRAQPSGAKTILGRPSGASAAQQSSQTNTTTQSSGGGWANVSRPQNAGNRPMQRQNPTGNVQKTQNRPGTQQKKNNYEMKEPRVSSVEVKEDWKVEKDIELSELSGVTFEPLEVDDLDWAGVVSQYNPSFSRIMPRNPVNLQRFENRQFFTASTTEDPILQKLIADKSATVYATDAILSLLMASPRSVNSWDILLRKTANGELIFDKRANSRIDYLSVNENWNESLTNDKESINHADHLTIEATVINHNFTQQCLHANKLHEFETPNPFLDSLAKGNEPAQVGFRYRKWDLGAGVSLVARTSLNGFVEKKDGEKGYLITRALNEFDPKLTGSVDWRQKLETQTGAVLASEMKNNSFKLARWVSESALSGADELRLGFVSRVNTKNSFRHAILMTKQYTPATFADSVNIKVKTLWGSLKVLIDRCLTLKEGRYLLLRDPAKSTIHIYAIPNDAFEQEGQTEADDAQDAAGQE